MTADLRKPPQIFFRSISDEFDLGGSLPERWVSQCIAFDENFPGIYFLMNIVYLRFLFLQASLSLQTLSV
jgi:hypothetical protein